MKCPYCGVRVSYFKAWKISRWKNHVCLNCGGESSTTTGNVVLMVACVLVPLFSIDMLFSNLQQPLHRGLYLALAILLSYIAHRSKKGQAHFFCKNHSINYCYYIQ